MQTDDLRTKLDTVSSKFQHLYTMNEALQQQLISLKAIEKKYKKLKEEKNQLKQTVVNLRSYIEMNMTEHGQIVLYKQEVEEEARQYIVDRLKEVNLFLQVNYIFIVCPICSLKLMIWIYLRILCVFPIFSL